MKCSIVSVGFNGNQITRGWLLEVWLALTIGLELSKPIRFYG